MNTYRNAFRNIGTSVCAIALALLAQPALAQSAPGEAAATASDAATPEAAGDEIIVTGTPGGSGTKKQDASYAITTISADSLAHAAPKSAAEVFSLVPGVWAESSGGVAGANIDVRGLPGGGDAPFVTFQINGSPIYGTEMLSFMEQSSLFRTDETISATEAVHGGPSAVFSNGEPGVTMNFNLKKGGDTTHGRAKFSATDYGQLRGDALISGPLGGGFYYMVGGYVTQSHGIRSAQFKSEKGKQITAQITKALDGGEINLWTRWTNDHGQWYLPMALGTGNDLGTFSQLGNFTRYESLRINATGATQNFDFAEGRGWKGSVSGVNAKFDLGGGVSVRDNLSYTKGDADTLGFVPDGAPVTVAALKAANAGLTSAVTAGGNVLANTAFVQNYGHWVVRKAIKSFTNDLSLNYKAGINDITVGFYHAAWSSRDFWTLGNFRPVQNVANGDYLASNISCTMLKNAGSGSGCWAYGIRSTGTAKADALYLADSIEVAPKLRFDFGIRQQWQSINYTVDSGPGYPDGTTDLTVNPSANRFSYTAAANYEFDRSLGVFIRYSKGFRFYTFDDLRDGGGKANVYNVKQFEAGVKWRSPNASLYLTGFYNNNDSFDFTQGSNNNAGSFKTRAYGVEVDGNLHYDGFALSALMTLQNAKVTSGVNNGHNVHRQPTFQLRLSPSYSADLGDNTKLTLFGAASFVGKRWSDLANSYQLSGYTKLDLGIEAKHSSSLFARVSADNLGNSHGLTEGDPRTTGSNNGRPILGRSFTFSVGYDF